MAKATKGKRAMARESLLKSVNAKRAMDAKGLLAEQYRCPPDVNFRFWLFVLATGAEVWENNVDYMLWIQGRKYAEASENAGAVLETNQYGWSTAEQVDAFMAAGVPIPTDEQVEKASRYFASMPSRQGVGL